MICSQCGKRWPIYNSDSVAKKEDPKKESERKNAIESLMNSNNQSICPECSKEVVEKLKEVR